MRHLGQFFQAKFIVFLIIILKPTIIVVIVKFFLQVDFSHTPELHVAFCSIFVHLFEVHALDPFLLFTSFLSKHLFSAVLSFFRESVRIEPHVAFRVVFVRPDPKLTP